MTGLLQRLVISPARNGDLIGFWLLSVFGHALVPLDHWLADDSLVPWLTLCMIVIGYLRAEPLGDPPPPSLTRRRVAWAAMLGRTSLMLSPLVLAAWFEWGRSPTRPTLYVSLGLTLACAILARAGRIDSRTAWRPLGGYAWWRWAVRVLLAIGCAHLFGLWYWLTDGYLVRWLFVAGLLGVQFVSLGVLPERLMTRWQRIASGRRDGSPYRPPIYPYLLALTGPGLGLAALLILQANAFPPVSFASGAVVSLHVFAWAAVIWPPRIPIAISCVLHEVVPNAGKDPEAKGATMSFENPPTGALRLNPLGVRRLRVMHHWVVSVHDPRIEDLDDPIQPLWPRVPLPQSYHVLGEAAFEPEPDTQLPQWHTITIRFEDQRDVNQLGAGGVQTRRLVVLRPFPRRRGLFGPTATRTYRWDPSLSAATIQVVDATTEQVNLQDGDILVLSSEGVARAFELEIGASIYRRSELGIGRPPQLEDYVVVS